MINHISKSLPRPLVLSLLLLVAVFFSNCQSSTTEEDNNKTTAQVQEQKVTIADVERGIRENIKAQTAENDGLFSFTNDTTQFSLKLVRVHTEYLSVLSPTQFFACVDLATADGDVYDMDFFLEGSREEMKVTRTTLHKLNGKPYYTWKQKKDKTWITVPVAEASNELLGVIEGKDDFIFTYQVTLPLISETAELWIPIAQSDRYQTIEILEFDVPETHEILKDSANQNSILYAKLYPEDSGTEIRFKYQVSRLEKAPYRGDDEDLLRYLQPSILMPVGDRFGVISEEIISKKQADSDLTKARAIYDYVIDNVRYAKQGVYGTGDANYACDSKSGNCTEYHSLFISLARSAGIPARFAVGAAIPSSRNEGGIDGYHCWAEFYADDKWWPVDISEADKYTALATYYFGHHPANRIEFSRGRDIAPTKMPQSGAINFLAYPVLEVNGNVEKVETSFSFERITQQPTP
jgi:hypothetical protein